MNELLKKLESLSPEKREIFLQKLRQKKEKSTNKFKLIPRKDNESIPLSFAQNRLWFLDRLEGKGSHYNVPLFLELKGRLETDKLQTSIESIIQRHEILRTNFSIQNEKPVQTITPIATFQFLVVDLEKKFYD